MRSTVVLIAALALVGCSEVVGSEKGASSAAPTVSAVPPSEPSADGCAFAWGDLLAINGAPPGGPAADPASLALIIGSAQATCTAPVGTACDERLLFVWLPPAWQKSGTVALADPSLHTRWMTGSCAKPGAVQGTIAVLSASSDSLIVRLAGGSGLDGLHFVTLCAKP